MKWAYGIENKAEVIKRNNTPLFIAIQSLSIAEDNIVLDGDDDFDRPKLQDLLVNIQTNDFLVIRSLEDLADSFEGMLSILYALMEKRVTLSSCKEVYLTEYNYYDVVKGLQDLFHYFYQQKRMIAYRQAVRDGKVGRPSAGKAKKCIELYLQGAIAKEDVLEMAGISEPTFYRYLRNSKGDEDNVDIERNDDSGV